MEESKEISSVIPNANQGKKKKKKSKAQPKKTIEEMMEEECEGNETSTYSKFKTQNEMDIEKAF